ncbi:hypothetical protein [Rhizobium sp. BK661]|uniref:hypothetical protein n=1 Tax=Rhizobium sp. BK661 TaxID=2586991 RepID=UPI0021688C22|nr:hypothetical protein [Rhizobium sp. BK661]MCS3740220.1 CTP synthase (UTP-ammonia lyase) [Rhizobium sp. BK661]
MFEEPKTVGRALGTTATALVLPQIVEVGKTISDVKELVRLQGERLLAAQPTDERAQAIHALIVEALAISERLDPSEPDQFSQDKAALQALLIADGARLVHWEAEQHHVHNPGDEEDDF